MIPSLDPVTAAVQRLYDTYPFPPEPLSDSPPPGYNWRWSWPAAYDFCTGIAPGQLDVSILDAGCGTGVGTEYLAYLNPQAQITAMDLSTGALEVAQARLSRLKTNHGIDNVQFIQASLLEPDLKIPGGPFDLINCVGVLHHLRDPGLGLVNLARHLKPGGICHIFVYGELGRWEIKLMQEALRLLQGDQADNYTAGVALGREVLATLPPDNRLRQREEQRWAMENIRDECFADMYLHPQEVDYTIPSLFAWLDTTDLEFLGFSNPRTWQLERLLGNNLDLLQRAQRLPQQEQYRLMELLDPCSITHYEFFLGRPPLPRQDWHDTATLRNATAQRHPCIDGWPGTCVFNSFYDVIHLQPAEMAFLQACDPTTPERTVGKLIAQTGLTPSHVYDLWQRKLILLSPPVE